MNKEKFDYLLEDNQSELADDYENIITNSEYTTEYYKGEGHEKILYILSIREEVLKNDLSVENFICFLNSCQNFMEYLYTLEKKEYLYRLVDFSEKINIKDVDQGEKWARGVAWLHMSIGSLLREEGYEKYLNQIEEEYRLAMNIYHMQFYHNQSCLSQYIECLIEDALAIWKLYGNFDSTYSMLNEATALMKKHSDVYIGFELKTKAKYCIEEMLVKQKNER